MRNALRLEHVSKKYHLGQIGTRTLSSDLQQAISRIWRKFSDPSKAEESEHLTPSAAIALPALKPHSIIQGHPSASSKEQARDNMGGDERLHSRSTRPRSLESLEENGAGQEHSSKAHVTNHRPFVWTH